MRQVAIGAAVILMAVPTMPARDELGSEALQLRLTIMQGTYAPYEPVVLQYALENTSNATVSYPGSVGLNSDWIKIEVGSGTLAPYRTGLIECAYPSDPRLGPHETLRAQVTMISNQFAMLDTPRKRRSATPFPFAEPGQYEIRASYPKGTNDPKDAFVSNTVRVRVREGTDREGQAIAFFGSVDAFAVAMGGEAVLEPGRGARPDAEAQAARSEAFLEAFADTPYAPHVRLNLAYQYLADSAPVPRPDLAAMHLKAVVDSGPHAIADDALLALAKAALAEGRVADAEASTAKLLRVFPESELAPDARRISKGLKAGQRTLHEILSR